MLTPEQKAARKLLRDLGEGDRIARATVSWSDDLGLWYVGQEVVRCSGGVDYEPIRGYPWFSRAVSRANRINRALGFPEVGP